VQRRTVGDGVKKWRGGGARGGGGGGGGGGDRGGKGNSRVRVRRVKTARLRTVSRIWMRGGVGRVVKKVVKASR